jgi:hypothetical protein
MLCLSLRNVLGKTVGKVVKRIRRGREKGPE